jgi:hypothetical protein
MNLEALIEEHERLIMLLNDHEKKLFRGPLDKDSFGGFGGIYEWNNIKHIILMKELEMLNMALRVGRFNDVERHLSCLHENDYFERRKFF